MNYSTIHKSPLDWRVPPNLGPEDSARTGFSWDVARSWLGARPDGAGLNMAHEAVDRHAAGPLASHVAIRWLGRHGERIDLDDGHLVSWTRTVAYAEEFAHVVRTKANSGCRHLLLGLLREHCKQVALSRLLDVDVGNHLRLL